MDQPQMRFLVDGFLPEDSVVVVWGNSTDCKTFMLVDMMLSMAHGIDWHGHKVKQGAVAYIVAEGARGIGKRIRGWKKQHKTEAINAPFFAIPTAINILKKTEVEKLIWQLQSVERKLGIKFEVIVVDTLAKCMVGGDENTARDMGIAISHCDLMREKMHCTVPAVHHSGKDSEKGPRGSNASTAGVNTQLHVVRHGKGTSDDHITVGMDKQKDHDDAVKLRLKVTKVVLPLRPGDDWRKPEDTLVLEDYTLEATTAAPRPMPGTEVDGQYADLQQIASVLGDDSENSVSAVAKMVFSHDRHRARILVAVPSEWTEVKTRFGVRYVRLVAKPAGNDRQRHFVQCRYGSTTDTKGRFRAV